MRFELRSTDLYCLQNHNHDLSKELDSRSKNHQRLMSGLLQPELVAQRLTQLGDALRHGDRDVIRRSRDNGPFQRALCGLGDLVFDIVGR